MLATDISFVLSLNEWLFNNNNTIINNETLIYSLLKHTSAYHFKQLEDSR